MKKMEAGEETIYGILLDVQKQIGELSRQTGEQTQKLISIEKKQGYTNGTVTKHGEKIETLEKKQENWSGKIAILSLVWAGIATIILGLAQSFIGKKIGL